MVICPLVAQDKVTKSAQPHAHQTPYGGTSTEDIKLVMDRVFHYVDSVTPVGIVNAVNGTIVDDLAQPVVGATLRKKPKTSGKTT